MKHNEKFVLVPFSEYSRHEKQRHNVEGSELDVSQAMGNSAIPDLTTAPQPPPPTPDYTTTTEIEPPTDFDFENFISYISRCKGGDCKSQNKDVHDTVTHDVGYSTQNTPPPFKKYKREWITL